MYYISVYILYILVLLLYYNKYLTYENIYGFQYNYAEPYAL